MRSQSKGERTSAAITGSMLDLIQVHGYAGVGLKAVLEHAEAPKGSLYFHFPEGKEQLGERALSLATEQFDELIRGAAVAAESPGVVVRQVMDALIDMVAQSDFTLGCPVSVVTLEMGAESDRLREACSRAYRSWTSALADVLVEHGWADAEAGDMAWVLVSTVEGSLIVARAMRDVAPMLRAADVLVGLVDSPVGGKSRS